MSEILDMREPDHHWVTNGRHLSRQIVGSFMAFPVISSCKIQPADVVERVMGEALGIMLTTEDRLHGLYAALDHMNETLGPKITRDYFKRAGLVLVDDDSDEGCLVQVWVEVES